MASTLARAQYLLLLTLVLGLAPSRTLAQSTKATGIMSFLQQVTTLSNNVPVAALKINLINITIQGFQIAVNFKTITSTISNHMAAMAPNPALLIDVDAQYVVATLIEFVKVHQALLQVVIGKHNLLTLIPFFEAIRQVLVPWRPELTPSPSL